MNPSIRWHALGKSRVHCLGGGCCWKMEDISITEVPRDASEGYSVTFRNAMKVPKIFLNCQFWKCWEALVYFLDFGRGKSKIHENFNHMALSNFFFGIFLWRFHLQHKKNVVFHCRPAMVFVLDHTCRRNSVTKWCAWLHCQNSELVK